MTKFRKKPVEIEAVQFGLATTRAEAWSWAVRNQLPGRSIRAVTDRHGHGLLIETLEGEMRANEGDWIIKGVAGELYPCKPDIFEATYEPV